MKLSARYAQKYAKLLEIKKKITDKYYPKINIIIIINYDQNNRIYL